MTDRILRGGWAKLALCAVLAIGGGIGGFLLATMRPGDHPPSPDARAAPPKVHAFPLTKLDAKDTVEAPSLAADPAGRVFLTWGSRTGEAERSILFTVSDDGGETFATPRVVNQAGTYRSASRSGGKGTGYERRATPHVAADGHAIHLAWAEALPGGSGIRMMAMSSRDGGQTFSPKQAVAHDAHANNTFVAMCAGPSGALACSWLDDRNGSQQVYAALRQSRSEWFAAEQQVCAGADGKGVCPCCATACAIGPDGALYVAFRDIAQGCRDMAVGALRPGQTAFAGPYPVAPPTWKFDGCPHDGPSLAPLGKDLHVVWMDARSGSQRCYHARAKLSDMTFTSQELHAIAVGTQGNAKLHVDPAGRLHAVWEESAAAPLAEHAGKHQHGAPSVTPGAGGRAIWHAVLGADGTFGSPHALAPRAGAFQTRPAIVVTKSGRVVVAWNELDEKGKTLIVGAFDAEVKR